MKKWKIAGIAAAVVVVAVGGYCGWRYKQGADYYASHFYDGTKVEVTTPDGSEVYACGDLSGMTLEEAEDYLAQSLTGYVLSVKGLDDTEDQVTAADLGLQVSEDGIAQLEQDLKEQDHSTWFKHTEDYKTASCDVTLTLGTVYDEAKLEDLTGSMKCVSPDEVEEGQVPEIAYDEANIRYVITDPVRSNQADPAMVLTKAQAAIASLADSLELTEEDYIVPELSDEEMTAMHSKVDAINQYLSANITVKDGEKSIVIDRSVIIGFLDIDEDYNCSLVTKSIQKYVNDNFDDLFDTLGTTRTINTVSSGTITVQSVTFGKVVSTLNEVKLLTQEITDGETVERAPEYRNSYEKTEENGGVGDTYIDVNIAKQKVYVVIDGKIVIETDCVTGLDNEERRTPTGLYYVIRKVRDYTMVKYDSFVSYWMPINDTTGVGLHDASWRSSFGGTIYKSNGSHGCINLPTSAAKEIFETVSVGIPVIVH